MLELPLLPNLAAVLKEHRRGQIAEQVKGLESGGVFPSPRAGRLLYASVLRKPIDRIAEAIELDRAMARGETALDRGRTKMRRPTVHGFRHTFNNLCRQVAAGEVVRGLTGHARAEMTVHYSQVTREGKRAATQGVLRLVASARGSDHRGDHRADGSETAG